jgi:hypothetical protein
MLSLVAGVRTVAVVVEGVEGAAVVSEDLLSSVLTGFIPPKRGCVARKCSGTGHLDMMWHRRVMDGGLGWKWFFLWGKDYWIIQIIFLIWL